MLKYTEKGARLHEIVAAAGHWMREKDGVWISSDDKAVQAIIDGYTLDDLKAARKAEISEFATGLRNKVVGAYSPGEMASWPLKLAEAKAFEASPASATPLLSIEASIRGVTLGQLVQRVLGNGSMFSTLEAAIAGREGYHRDMVDACKTFEEVAAYDFSAGWLEA